MNSRFKRAWSVWNLTGFPAGRFVPEPAFYRFNGVRHRMAGEYVLAMFLDLYSNDSYGLKRLKAPKTIVDVGAYVGVFSAIAVTRFPTARVYAFEPTRESFETARANLEPFSVELYQAGIGEKDGFGIIERGSDPTANRVIPVNGSGRESTAFRVLPIDQVVHDVGGEIDILKLDCEGAEYPILASDALKNVKHIVGELHTTSDNCPEDALAMLKKNNFEIVYWRPFADPRAGIVWADRRD